jgi:polar amino acid transport system permease protein
MLPHKNRRNNHNLQRPEDRGDAQVTIEIADGPAVPRAADPGLYSAWKFVVLVTPALLLWLIYKDRIAYWMILSFPNSLGNWTWLEKLANPDNPYRAAFFFIMPDGILVTLKITFFSIIGSIILGLVTGLCRVSKIRFIYFLASLYVEVVRGVPLLAQLFFIYYGLGDIIKVPPIVAGVGTLSFCYGAYMGEVFRSGIDAIDRGQREAAMSLGFGPLGTMIYVILPQAFRTILPPLGNECIAMLKDTSLISIIAISDVMRLAREYASATFYSYESYSIVVLVYLFITLILSKLVSLTETHVGRYERR